jgi:hypothetical protein
VKVERGDRTRVSVTRSDGSGKSGDERVVGGSGLVDQDLIARRNKVEAR